MALTTIMGHLQNSQTELSFRSVSNLENQKVTPFQLARECKKLGWPCFQVDDRVWIAKSDSANNSFRAEYTANSYIEI